MGSSLSVHHQETRTLTQWKHWVLRCTVNSSLALQSLSDFLDLKFPLTSGRQNSQMITYLIPDIPDFVWLWGCVVTTSNLDSLTMSIIPKPASQPVCEEHVGPYSHRGAYSHTGISCVLCSKTLLDGWNRNFFICKCRHASDTAGSVPGHCNKVTIQ